MPPPFNVEGNTPIPPYNQLFGAHWAIGVRGENGGYEAGLALRNHTSSKWLPAPLRIILCSQVDGAEKFYNEYRTNKGFAVCQADMDYLVEQVGCNPPRD